MLEFCNTFYTFVKLTEDTDYENGRSFFPKVNNMVEMGVLKGGIPVLMKAYHKK